MDKYGYIGIETLLDFCENSKDHAITPNDFMRMNRVKEPPRIRGHWIPSDTDGFVCSVCRNGYRNQPTLMGKPMFEFCPVCGAKMEVTE